MYPPAWLLALGSFVSAAGLALVFLKGWDTHPGSAAIYGLSAWCLAAAVLRAIDVFPRIRAGIRGHSLYQRYNSIEVRARLTLQFSLCVNAAFALFKGAAGIWLESWWFGTIAAYYLVLSLARLWLLRAMKRGSGPEDGWRLHARCGWLLLALTIVISGISALVIYTDNGPRYPGVMIYAFAAYAFFTLYMAVWNVLKFRRLKNPLYSAAKALSLATAIVSLYFMQTAMLRQFGEDAAFQHTMNALSGGAAALLVLGIAIAMIWADRKAKKCKGNTDDEVFEDTDRAAVAGNDAGCGSGGSCGGA